MANPFPSDKTLLGSGPVAVPLLTLDQISGLVRNLSDDEVTSLVRVTHPFRGNDLAYCAAVTDWFHKGGAIAQSAVLLFGGVS